MTGKTTTTMMLAAGLALLSACSNSGQAGSDNASTTEELGNAGDADNAAGAADTFTADNTQADAAIDPVDGNATADNGALGLDGGGNGASGEGNSL